MQNLITANSVNITLDEATAGLGGGSSGNFTSKVSADSQSGEKFTKIFEDTTRRQDKAVAASATDAANATSIANTTNTTGTTGPVNTTDTTNATNNNKETETPEIKQNTAQAEIILPATPEIETEADTDDSLNLNEVKAPEILIAQNPEPVQEDFEIVVNEAETTAVSGQSEEISNLGLDNSTKDAAIKTTTTEEEQKPVQKTTGVQGQNVIQSENNQGRNQAILEETQSTRPVKNQETVQQTQSKEPAIELPQEAVVDIEPDTLLVSENDIVDSEGEVVQFEQPQTKKSEDAPHIRAIDKNIIEELEAKVEKVIVTPQPQTNNSKVLGSTLSASEHVVKLSIEDALATQSGKNTEDAGAEDLLNGGKQNFNPEAFKLNLSASTHNNSAPATFDEALKNDVLNQIGTKFEQLQQDGGVGKITLALRPLELGRVVIELTQNANGITTNIIAQNSSVKELLEKNIEGLKQQLAQAGVSVQNINVKAADSGEKSEQGEHEGHRQEEEQEGREQGGSNSRQRNNKDNEKEE